VVALSLSSRAVQVLGAPAAASGWTTLTESRLRVVAYHDVPDATAFSRQLDLLCERWVPVSAEQVRRAAAGGRLPRRALWLTFDDGHPAVVDTAMAVLDAAGVHATAFVCPAVVDTCEPYWFQVVDAAVAEGLAEARSASRPGLRARLKAMRDSDRRSAVAALLDQLADRGVHVHRRQITSDQLDRWRAGGHEVGSHSWDHPLLDRCDDDEQRRQVRRAHAWLADRGMLPARPFFALPNGNRAAVAEDELRCLGYGPPLLFDHRLARPARTGHVSRLRLDAAADARRTAAVVSGLQPAAQHLLRRG
jgi:peptidoglycan/xylan/chitin deacetylase (PgdA/CDA1 family)